MQLFNYALQARQVDPSAHSFVGSMVTAAWRLVRRWLSGSVCRLLCPHRQVLVRNSAPSLPTRVQLHVHVPGANLVATAFLAGYKPMLPLAGAPEQEEFCSSTRAHTWRFLYIVNKSIIPSARE